MGIWIIFEQAQLTNLAVNKKYQGKGYGRKLLEMGISLCQEAGCEIMTLEVRQSNVVAKSLYQSCGFEKVSVKKDYYQDNHEDADVMMKGLI
jgi:ribosomal-protein-alanine N-acetyltransferase